MDIIRDQLEKEVTLLRKMLRKYTNELQQCPSGRLINNRNNQKPVFYHSERLPDQKYKRKVIHKDNPMLSTLARKEYLTKIIPLIQSNLMLMEQTLRKYASLDPADIINSMGRAYRLLDSKSFFCNEEKDLFDVIPDIAQYTDEYIRFRYDVHREWASEDYPKNPYPFPEEILLTSSGERVRSRGEIIIYDRLEHFGVPSRYDQLIYLNDGTAVSPDFSFEDKNYDEFYLEYCGMMSNNDYVKDHLRKRNAYERNGIVPWKNIYFLYSADNGISVPEIDSVIRYYIIPRL